MGNSGGWEKQAAIGGTKYLQLPGAQNSFLYHTVNQNQTQQTVTHWGIFWNENSSFQMTDFICFLNKWPNLFIQITNNTDSSSLLGVDRCCNKRDVL